MKMLFLSFLMLIILSACAVAPPSDGIKLPPANDISLAEVQQDYKRFIGSPVRWGGRILKVVEVAEQGQEYLHLEVLEYPLDKSGKPIEVASSGGRFIARISPPYKTIRYYRGRLVTLVGNINGIEVYPLASGEEQQLPLIYSGENYAWRQEYRDDSPDYWPHFFFRYGISNHGTGVGVIFH
jgi:outer membrane lipoprotein